MTNKQKWINALDAIVFPDLKPGRKTFDPKDWSTNKIMSIMVIAIALLVITIIFI